MACHFDDLFCFVFAFWFSSLSCVNSSDGSRFLFIYFIAVVRSENGSIGEKIMF